MSVSASQSQEITPLGLPDAGGQPPDGNSPELENAEPTPVPDGGGDPEAPGPTSPQQSRRNSPRISKPPNCMEKFGGMIMKVFAHDAIYGSFVGPHPVQFLALCAPCRSKVDRKCLIPFSVASIATKTMYFIMLGIVTILAAFFIIPWPESLLSTKSTVISKFYPCQGKNLRNMAFNGGCEAHAGYFMVYRCFLAFATTMLFNSFVLSFVDSTSENPHRAKIHQGFWLYKYLLLAGLMAFYFLFLTGTNDKEGIFELFCSILGNIAHMIFSLVELTYIMDVVEFWVIANAQSGPWADFFYWCTTGIVSLCSLTLFIYICVEFSRKRTFVSGISGYFDNCVPGTMGDVDEAHAGMIAASFFTVLALIIAMCFKKKFKKYFRHVGWLQVAVISIFNFSYLWSALYSSPSMFNNNQQKTGVNFISKCSNKCNARS
ncbi:putative serine incorporator [Orchesella cincta]|uniref:Putative serine incorporator n=1 Tax=Orchesella cincta TaxID=48709 RepID=A0A1D2NGW6_ORCCI|nr:putative serine incorporator [Orchesella cincta]